MPRKNQPRTLQKLCIDSATEMLCHLNDSYVTDDFPWLLNKEENPFFCLPKSLLKTIIQNFCSSLYNNRRAYCKKYTFLILFCQKMDEIDLSDFFFSAEDYLDILDWIEKTSSDVKYFQNNIYQTIDGYDYKNRPFLFEIHTKSDTYNIENRETLICIQTKLIKLISSMNSLTHLVLNEFCNDRVLDAIGKSCPNIIRLKTNCDKITDLGLQSLWMNVNDPSDKTRRCQNIESLQLKFYAEGVTDDGIKMLLKNLSQLKFISSNSLSSCILSNALIQMHKDDYMMCEQIYQLKEFSYSGNDYNSEEISSNVPKILSKVAPYITTLSIENATEEELIQFGQLKHVENLTLKDYHNLRNTFENGILPLLEKIGSNLRKLNVYGYEVKDLLAVGSLCPKLEKLICDFSEFNSDYPTLNYQRAFQNLKKLKIFSHPPKSLPTTYLRKILRNCEELKTLIVHATFLLTDEDLVEIMKEDLASVEYLDISRIPRISVSSIEEILSQENDLKTFKIKTLSYFDETLTRIKQIIKENNLNLSFQYP